MSLPGRFNLGCIVAFAFVWEELFQLAPSSHQKLFYFFQNIGMLNADTGMLSAPGMLNIGMLNADLGMLSAPGMLNFFFFCEDNLLHLIYAEFLFF